MKAHNAWTIEFQWDIPSQVFRLILKAVQKAPSAFGVSYTETRKNISIQYTEKKCLTRDLTGLGQITRETLSEFFNRNFQGKRRGSANVICNKEKPFSIQYERRSSKVIVKCHYTFTNGVGFYFWELVLVLLGQCNTKGPSLCTCHPWRPIGSANAGSWLSRKKSFVLFCPIGVQLLHSRFHVFLHSVCFICHNLILIYTSREIILDVSEKRFRPYNFCPVYFVLPRLTAPGSPRMCTSWPANVKLKGGQNAIWRHADHDDYFRMEKLTTFYQPGCSLTDWWFQTMSRKHWQSSPPLGFTLKVHLHLYILNNVFSFLFALQMSQYNGNWTEWSAVWY